MKTKPAAALTIVPAQEASMTKTPPKTRKVASPKSASTKAAVEIGEPKPRSRGRSRALQADKTGRIVKATRRQAVVVQETLPTKHETKTEAKASAKPTARKAVKDPTPPQDLAEKRAAKSTEAKTAKVKSIKAKSTEAAEKPTPPEDLAALSALFPEGEKRAAKSGEAISAKAEKPAAARTSRREIAARKKAALDAALIVTAKELAAMTPVVPAVGKSSAKPVSVRPPATPADDPLVYDHTRPVDWSDDEDDDGDFLDLESADGAGIERPDADPVMWSRTDLERARSAVGRIGREKPVRMKVRVAEPTEHPERRTDPWSHLLIVPENLRREKRRRLRVIGYLRYSSQIQTVRSLIRQANFQVEFCNHKDFDLLIIFKDEATSGTKENRPGLDAAVKMIAEGKADILLAEHCDRFARKHSILPNLFDRINDLGAQLWTLNDGHIKDGTMANLLGAMAAEDRNKTVSRFDAGKRLAIKQGRIPNLGYGYRKVEICVWEIDEEQAAIVRLIFVLTLKGVQPTALAHYLNARGVRSSRGGAWSRASILVVLKNPIYVGIYLFGRHTSSKSRKPSPHGTIELHVPQLAIVTREAFEAVAALRKSRVKFFGEKRAVYNYDFLYRRVWCAATGARMSFLCEKAEGSKQDAFRSQLPTTLDRKRLNAPASLVRKAVLDAVAKRILTPQGEAVFDAERAAARERERRELAGRKTSLGLKLAAANAKADASFEDGWMEGASHERRVRRREELEARVSAIQDDINAVTRRQRVFEDGDECRASLRERFAALREEGVAANGSIASFELVHAMRSILVRVDVDIDQENGWIDIVTTLAPNGDAEFMLGKPRADIVFVLPGQEQDPEPADVVETVTETQRVYFRNGRKAGDEYLSRAVEALDRGWLSISQADYQRLEERAPALQSALPKTSSIRMRMCFVRAVLAIWETGLSREFLDVLVPTEGRRRFRYWWIEFRAQGGPRQLAEALCELKLPGLPAPDIRRAHGGITYKGMVGTLNVPADW